ncbi:MAG: acyl-CoA dehydrogenase family protein [Isosphaeraceae bacterium]
MSTTAPDREAEALRAQQMAQAEELLFSGPQREGFAKALFRGEFHPEGVFPYPELPPAEKTEAEAAAARVKAFAIAEIDPVAIDRDADIPPRVVEGLARLGVMGMTAPKKFGGQGFSQSAYCKVMEVIGGHCASTAVFVNAHHSIGIRALLLFGTPEQQARWLPPLCRAEKLGAFALTETEAGSDASNVRTEAVPSEDGRTYRLTGTKRYITNGAIADVLTVMARTPDPKGGDSKVTAFLVTPDMPGFEVVEARMDKCGIRGTATAKLAFHDMPVPAENVLGPLGKGLRVALTVLDFGRTTFGASCTGMSKTLLAAAVRHAKRRRQFGKALAELELIQKKIAELAAHSYAMEATTYQTAALIDRGTEDFMLETAILKVFSTEVLWQGSYEVLQIHGGQGYFTDEPYERIMRDCRINTIGEGANEVLKAFIALVGMRDVAEGFKTTLEGLKSPSRFASTLWTFGKGRIARATHFPQVPIQSPELRADADLLARQVGQFGRAIERALFRHREAILDRQYVQERLADAAIALFTASCTLARLDRELTTRTGTEAQRAAGRHYLAMARRNFDRAIRGLDRNDDESSTRAALANLAAFD